MAYTTAAGMPMQGQLEAQSFWDTFKKYAPIVINAVSQLSATPQVGQGFQPQSAGPSFAPQAGGPQGQLQTQSFWDSFVQYAPVVIGAIAALEASPQIPGMQGTQPQSAMPSFAPQSAAPQGQLDPQSFWDTFKKYAPIVINAVSQLSATPQVGQGFQPQSAGPGFAPLAAAPQGQLQTQSFWDSFIKYAPTVIGAIAALEANPQVSGMQGMQPQSAAPSFAPQSAAGGQSPDMTSLVSRIVPMVVSAMQSSSPPPNSVIH